ncbi:hypothetical protein AX15_001153 [Amanita polypyramis BW_CC]|nr:hypothetical protein AX15_001153 [Amanita polypyramis BW_CC]
MVAKKQPISKIKSDPNLSVSCPIEKLPATVLTHLLGAELPMQQLRSFHGDLSVICSASEPNLVLSDTAPTDSSLRPSILFSHMNEQLHVPGPVTGVLPEKKRTPLIRFQSRVRIVSGIARHRQKSSDVTAHDMSISPRSSPPSSRASSIYAPLRSRSDNDGSSWEMSQRVSKVAFNKRGRKRLREGGGKVVKQCGLECARLREYNGPNHIINEQTPLIKHTIQSAFEREGMNINGCNSDKGAHSSRAVDFTFGTWPGRLLNRYVSLPEGHPMTA